MRPTIAINPEMLNWALERSGLIAESLTSTPQLKHLLSWLESECQPTLSQLEQFATATNTPLGYFFLKHPPEEIMPIRDFRTKDGSHPRQPSPGLLETIYDMQRRQMWIREYLIENGFEPLKIVGAAPFNPRQTSNNVVESLADAMREHLRLRPGWTIDTRGNDAAIKRLRTAMESAGIFVFFNGVVGTNTGRALNPEEFRGFVMIDDYAPIVFVNNADAKTAKLFTLAHELVHVWLGADGIIDVEPVGDQQKIEAFCNRVAAEFLMPQRILVKEWRKSANFVNVTDEISRKYRISRLVVARRAFDLGFVDASQFFPFVRSLKKEFAEQKKREGKTKSSGGSFWNNTSHYLGDRFPRAVISAVQSDRMGYREAMELTGLRGPTLNKLAERLANG